MNGLKRTLYYGFVLSIKLYQRLFLDLCVWGRDRIPKGPKLFVTNHITCTDALWPLPIFGEFVDIIIGPPYQYSMFAALLDSFEQINAMPGHRKNAVAEAVTYLERGESVFICPEADMQELFQLGRFYPGVARIYRRARVPIVPIALVAPKRCMHESPRINTVIDGRVYRMLNVLRGTYCINVGEPFAPECPGGSDEEQDERITALVKARIEQLMDDVRRTKFWL